MEIEKQSEGGRLIVKVTGRLNTNTSPELEAELSLDGVSEVVFDFAGLEYISSAGLRVLMVAKKTMMARGGRAVVANPNKTVRDVFDITGLSDVFEIA